MLCPFYIDFDNIYLLSLISINHISISMYLKKCIEMSIILRFVMSQIYITNIIIMIISNHYLCEQLKNHVAYLDYFCNNFSFIYPFHAYCLSGGLNVRHN